MNLMGLAKGSGWLHLSSCQVPPGFADRKHIVASLKLNLSIAKIATAVEFDQAFRRL